MKNVLSLFLLCSISLGCDNGPSSDAPKTGADGSKSAPSTAKQGELGPVVDAYDGVRAALANDDLAAATSAAKALESAAKAASLNALASSAEALGKVGTDDADALRLAFGHVSEALIAKLADDDALRGSLHVFECPMAKGFGKWVQRDKELKNPYMGKAMLTCGSESEWKS